MTDRKKASPSSGTDVPDGEEGSMVEGESSRPRVTESDAATTGAGAEASEGIHATQGERSEELSGSEPLRHRETEHKSGYGGEKGKPKTSSDQR